MFGLTQFAISGAPLPPNFTQLVSWMEKKLQLLSSSGSVRSEKACFAHVTEVCPLSLHDFVARVIYATNKYTEEADVEGLDTTGVRCALISIEYLERSKVSMTSENVHRYFLTGFVIAFKLSDDLEVDNTWWAHVGGCDLKDVNAMELELCSMMHWECGVSPAAYQSQWEHAVARS